MGLQYDEEHMVSDIETLYKNKLNAAIDSINSEKNSVSGDSLFIPNIAVDKYIFGTLDKRIMNYRDFFVLFGISDTPIRDAQENNYIEDLTIQVSVGTFDDGNADLQNVFYQLLRYRRALKKVIMENTDVFRGYAKPMVQSLRPDAFPYSSKKNILHIGVDIKASVTAR